jgi:hypothetical protein
MTDRAEITSLLYNRNKAMLDNDHKKDFQAAMIAAGTLALHYQNLEAEYRRLWKQKIPIDIEKIEV